MGAFAWTTEEYAIFLRMRAEGASIKHIAHALQRSKRAIESCVFRYNRRMGVVRRTLTKEQLNHILDTWAYIGPSAARALAPQYGISQKYVKTLAKVHGVKVKRRTKRSYPRYVDPRWERAKAIGPVIA